MLWLRSSVLPKQLSRPSRAKANYWKEAWMPAKLHRCGNPARFGPCWRVQKALDEKGIDYEVVPGPWRPKNRTAVIEGTGQRLYPAIQFANGSWYREESRDMARAIRQGRLMEKQSG
jgi:hypothetical protein